LRLAERFMVGYFVQTPVAPTLIPIAEVVLSTTTQFVAQCIELPRPQSIGTLPEPPPFGSIVRVSDSKSGNLFGVVFHVETGALEANRPLSALGLTEEELQRDQPQIYELLTTRFTAALIGYQSESGTIRHYLPPRPPRPHTQVFSCTPIETRCLTEEVSFLRGLLLGETGVTSGDELVAALLRNALSVREETTENLPYRAYLRYIGRELATLLRNDTTRLRALLEKVVH
jgi:hypothetical protein